MVHSLSMIPKTKSNKRKNVISQSIHLPKWIWTKTKLRVCPIYLTDQLKGPWPGTSISSCDGCFFLNCFEVRLSDQLHWWYSPLRLDPSGKQNMQQQWRFSVYLWLFCHQHAHFRMDPHKCAAWSGEVPGRYD